MAISYAQVQFGKPLEQITNDDLTEYFSTERDESLTLEFKSFMQHENDIKHKENGVLRTICAFLNSNGGLVIWGAPAGTKNGDKQKVFIGALSPVEKRYSKDDFISKISTRIIPFAAPVQLRSVEVSAEKFVYLIDVPESAAKPHQFDNTYYIRLDGQTKPAPHYIINALFNQIKNVKIGGTLMFHNMVSTGDGRNQWLHLDVDIYLVNLTKFIPEYDLYYQISTEGALFNNPNTVRDVSEQSPVFRQQVVNMLPYGVNIKRKESFRIHLETLSSKIFPHDPDYFESTIPVIFLFGGRNSSYKKSYLISLNYKVSSIHRNITTLNLTGITETEVGDF